MPVNFTCNIWDRVKRGIVITAFHVLNSIFIIRFKRSMYLSFKVRRITNNCLELMIPAFKDSPF